MENGFKKKPSENFTRFLKKFQTALANNTNEMCDSYTIKERGGG